MKQFYSDIHGLSFELKNNRLAIVIDGKRHWVDVPKNAQKKLDAIIQSHFDHEEYLSNLTDEQKRDHYAEMSCS